MTDTDATRSNPLNDPSFVTTVREQFITHFLEPELERRQIPGTGVRQFAAIISPGGGTRVLIDDEVTWVAHAAPSRSIDDGEIVTSQDIAPGTISAVRPAAAGPNDAWVGVADLDSHRLLTFNFRRNRGTSRSLLDRAEEFLTTGLAALDRGHLGPATETLFAAAELAVKAEMFLTDDSPTTVHHKREAYFRSWAELGNATICQAEALETLRAARPSARYGDDGPKLTLEKLRQIADEVREQIDMVRLGASHPLD